MAKNYSSHSSDQENIANMFYEGVEAMKKRGKADSGEKTMLDVLIPVSKEMQKFSEQEDIKLIAEKLCDNRLVSILEGGYNISALSSCVLEHIKVLAKYTKTYSGPIWTANRPFTILFLPFLLFLARRRRRQTVFCDNRFNLRCFFINFWIKK